MYVVAKQNSILEKPTEIKDAKAVIGYSEEGGSPLFVIMEHGGKTCLSVHGDKNFEEVLDLVK